MIKILKKVVRRKKGTKVSKSQRARKAPSEKKISFEYYAPHAGHVKLAGTFNGWNPEISTLKMAKDGKWKAQLSLPPGRYEYRYQVDGQWENDQRSVECVPNNFGTWNNVVEVG